MIFVQNCNALPLTLELSNKQSTPNQIVKHLLAALDPKWVLSDGQPLANQIA